MKTSMYRHCVQIRIRPRQAVHLKLRGFVHVLTAPLNLISVCLQILFLGSLELFLQRAEHCSLAPEYRLDLGICL